MISTKMFYFKYARNRYKMTTVTVSYNLDGRRYTAPRLVENLVASMRRIVLMTTERVLDWIHC